MNAIIPEYKSDSLISQPISIDGNIGAIRCGKLITQNIIIPSIEYFPLIRVKNNGGLWICSQTKPASFISTKQYKEIDDNTYDLTKYSIIKYGDNKMYGGRL